MVVQVVHCTKCPTKRVRTKIQLALYLPSHEPWCGAIFLHKDTVRVSRGPILLNKFSGSPALKRKENKNPMTLFLSIGFFSIVTKTPSPGKPLGSQGPTWVCLTACGSSFLRRWELGPGHPLTPHPGAGPVNSSSIGLSPLVLPDPCPVFPVRKCTSQTQGL